MQRFLYGQGVGRAVRTVYGESPIKVMRRTDVASARVTLARDADPVELRIIHTDLYFFFDVDVAILALEVACDDVDLATAQDALFRFGRAYPAYWEEDARGGHCPWRVEWLGHDGEVLAVSDYEKREKYLAFVCQHRAPAVAAHWEYLLSPLVLHHRDKRGPVRYRQLEYYRMPYHGLLRRRGSQGADAGRSHPHRRRQRAGQLLGAALFAELRGQVRGAVLLRSLLRCPPRHPLGRHPLHVHRPHAGRRGPMPGTASS